VLILAYYELFVSILNILIRSVVGFSDPVICLGLATLNFMLTDETVLYHSSGMEKFHFTFHLDLCRVAITGQK
jgi:hypothetical protein